MPPPAAAELSVDHLVPSYDLAAEPGDEQPATSRAAAAAPASARRYDDLTVPPEDSQSGQERRLYASETFSA
jgi:hypothetical protein